jgi:alanine racemase
MSTARLQVNLDALAQNFHLLRQRGAQSLPADCVAAVVKANGYGLGMHTVARRLYQEGCRRFFVASATEGGQLRDLLPDVHIYVLAGATRQTLGDLVAQRLTPVLNTLQQCELWSTTPQAGPAALHIDTGMHRLGLSWEDDLSQLPALQLDLLMTHFARADEGRDTLRPQQTQRFADSVAVLRDGHPNVLVSLNNSAAVLTDQVTRESVLDASDGPRLDRLGIGLYGVNPHTERETAAAKQALANVATLEGQVLQVRHVKAGATVGYGSTYCVRAPGRLVTIGAGYADGVPRLLSNQGHVFFRGRRLPMVGRISMDSLVVELTDETALACDINEGDWVEIFGPHLPVEEVAQQAQTIAYEVFTGLGSRLQRLS